MTSGRRHVGVLVTAPDSKTARRLARAALEKRVAACASLVNGVESHYWWEGRMCRAKEVMMVFKTTRAKLARLASLVRSLHPYDTPEILALPVASGSRRYLRWVEESVGQML